MKNTSTILTVAAILVSISAIAAHADVLTKYQMYDPPKPGTGTYGPDDTAGPYVIIANAAGADSNDNTAYTPPPGVTAGDLGLGAGFSPDYNFRLGFSPLSGDKYATTVAGAKTAGDYVTFTIAPSVAGTALDLTNIDFSNLGFITSYGDTDTTETFTLESSADNFSSVMGSFTGSAFVNTISGSDIAIDLNQLTGPTEFRLYMTIPGSSTNLGETGLYQGNINVDGSVVAAITTPEPSTYALLGLGVVFLVMTVRNRRSFSI